MVESELPKKRKSFIDRLNEGNHWYIFLNHYIITFIFLINFYFFILLGEEEYLLKQDRRKKSKVNYYEIDDVVEGMVMILCVLYISFSDIIY